MRRKLLKSKLRLSVTEVALIALYVVVLLGALALTRGIERANPKIHQRAAEVERLAADGVRASPEARV